VLTVNGAVFTRILHVGMSGLDVGAIQRMLTRAGVRTYWESPGGPGGVGYYGTPMGLQVNRFVAQRNRRVMPRDRITISGVVGPRVFRWLAPYADDLAKEMLRQAYKHQHPQSSWQQHAVEWAHFNYLHRWNNPYSQSGNRVEIVNHLPELAHRVAHGDCSTGYWTWMTHGGGPFPGTWTGDQVDHGTWLPSPGMAQPADAAFYSTHGSRRATTHVAMVASPGGRLIYSHGHDPMELTYMHYRRDLVGVMRYGKA
jgi:hypothetical protein